jgi:hypothetical protein
MFAMSRRPKQKAKSLRISRSKQRLIRPFIFSAVFGLMGCVLLFYSFAASPPPFTVAPNPALNEGCGGSLDIALVADVSGSILGFPGLAPNELPTIQSAFTSFISSLLPGTNSMFSLTEFSNTATILQPFTNNVTALDGAVGRLAGGGTTNWTDGLQKGLSTFSGLSATAPKLLVIATDGDPTTTVADAVNVANQAKAAGIHVLAMGLGDDPTLSNLEALSGTHVNAGGANTDVVTTDFSTMGAALLSLTNGGCGNGGNGSGGNGNGNGDGGTGTGTGGTGTGTGGTGTGSGGTGTGQEGPSAGPSKPNPEPSPNPAPAAVASTEPNPAPKPTSQGTQPKPPTPQPSPFYDGKQYARDSIPDTAAIVSDHSGISTKWYIILFTLLFLSGIGYAIWRRRTATRRNKPSSARAPDERG